MEAQQHLFSNKTVNYYFDAALTDLEKIVEPLRTILIIDDNVERLHGSKLTGWRKIVIKGDETSKSLTCTQKVIDELIALEADRKTTLVGIGGGVTTDLTGFVASIYMRGIAYGFVPSTLLAQVDASVGGKNGINYGRYKNILGIIQQPDFLLFDYDLLDTLSPVELHSGFAEIIKYGCIYDAELFNYLETHSAEALNRNRTVINHLVRRSVEIKTEVVLEDQYESGLRRILNFGHTIGHAVEKLEKIPHGYAVAKGMVIAAQFSTELTGLSAQAVQRLTQLITTYQLPTNIASDTQAIEELFKMDKKREQDFIHFILLNHIGKVQVFPIALTELSLLLEKHLSPSQSH